MKILLLCVLMLFSFEKFAQSAFQEIKIIEEIPSIAVKGRVNTGICWSFGATSFIEPERKGEFDLPETYTIHCTYKDYAGMYVRYHGNLNFGSGAEGWNLFNAIKSLGMFPQEAYPGLIVNPQMHEHIEMEIVLKSMIDVLVKQDKLTRVWNNAIGRALDACLENCPKEFDYKGTRYNPKSFHDYLGIDVKFYCAFTSFANNLYYSEIVFESPDNWSNGIVINVELDDLIKIIDHA